MNYPRKITSYGSLLLHPNPLMLGIWRGTGLFKYVTTQLLNYLEERRKMPWGREKKNALALGSGTQTFSGAVKRSGCSLSRREVPVGQTEMLWFLFKMLLHLGKRTEGCKHPESRNNGMRPSRVFTTVKRLDAVIPPLTIKGDSPLQLHRAVII